MVVAASSEAEAVVKHVGGGRCRVRGCYSATIHDIFGHMMGLSMTVLLAMPLRFHNLGSWVETRV